MLLPTTYTRSIDISPDPLPQKRVTQKFHFAILRIEVTHASCGLSAIPELLVSSAPVDTPVLYSWIQLFWVSDLMGTTSKVVT